MMGSWPNGPTRRKIQLCSPILKFGSGVIPGTGRQFSQGEANLSSTMVTLLAFACTFGASLVGIFIRDRLPPQHVEGDAKEVVKLVLGLMATLTALVLGLLISSAHSSFDAQGAELQQLSIHVYQLDRILAHMGPDATPLRGELHRIVTSDLERIWPTEGGVKPPDGAAFREQEEIEGLFESIAKLTPKTDLERAGQSHALDLLGSIGETRHLLIAQSRGSLSWPFLVVLMSWMSVLFFGFGLFALYNGTAVAALFVGSLSVAGAIALILEMNQPYHGWIQVSSAPLRNVLLQIGH